MFTTCPQCGTVFRIGPVQLRAAEGLVRCGACSATFNALLSLADEPATAPGPRGLPAAASRASQWAGDPGDLAVASDPGYGDEPPARAWPDRAAAGEPPADDDDEAPLAPGDPLAGVVEQADWESLLTGLDDDQDEPAEPVYIVEDEPRPPALPPGPDASATAAARDAGPSAPAPLAAPNGTEPSARAGETGPVDGPGEPHPGPASPWPLDEDDADRLPPLGQLDDGGEHEPADESLPPLGPPAAADELPATLHEPAEAASGATAEIPLAAAALATATRQQGPGVVPAVPEPWADRPAWPPAPGPAPRGRWRYGVGSLLLLLTLAAQVVTHRRDELATHPEWGWLVRDVYARLGMDIYPAWDLAAYEVRGSEAVAGRSAAGALDIVARIAVVGSEPAGLPLVRVTLRDRRGDVLGQRVVEAPEYLPADAAPTDPASPGTLIPVAVSLPDPGVDASGYEVDICLPRRGQDPVCQGERETLRR